MTGIACNDMIDANLRNMVKIIILDIHASAKDMNSSIKTA